MLPAAARCPQPREAPTSSPPRASSECPGRRRDTRARGAARSASAVRQQTPANASATRRDTARCDPVVVRRVAQRRASPRTTRPRAASVRRAHFGAAVLPTAPALHPSRPGGGSNGPVGSGDRPCGFPVTEKRRISTRTAVLKGSACTTRPVVQAMAAQPRGAHRHGKSPPCAPRPCLRAPRPVRPDQAPGPRLVRPDQAPGAPTCAPRPKSGIGYTFRTTPVCTENTHVFRCQ